MGEARAILHLHWGGRSGSLKDVALVGDGKAPKKSSDPNWCGVYLDGKLVCRLVRGRRVALRIAPGRRSLVIGYPGKKSSAEKIRAEPGSDLFYECRYGINPVEGAMSLVGDILLDATPHGGVDDSSSFWLWQVEQPPKDD